MRNNKGITLIALVVTIVILIILATISIQLVLNSGLLGRTESSATLHRLQEEKERLEVVKGDVASETTHAGIVTVEYYVQELIKQGITTADKVTDNGDGSKTVITDSGYKATISPRGEKDVVIRIEGDKIETNPGENPDPEKPETPTTPAGTVAKKPDTWTSEKVTAIADGKGGIVPLPNGYHYVGGDIDTGLVISDKEGDTMDASGTSMGSQFVWIPANAETLTISEVIKYGGFYIGRFEAGVNSTVLRTKTQRTIEVVSKRGVAPCNWMPWGGQNFDVDAIVTSTDNKTITGSTFGAVKTARDLYEHPDSVESLLCDDCHWSALTTYCGESLTAPSGMGSIKLTGSCTSDVSKNIFDLAGNCWELMYSCRCTGKGSFQVEEDYEWILTDPTAAFEYLGFRLVLYIK